MTTLAELGPSLLDEAWEGALALIRARGEDPDEVIALAAARIEQWAGLDDDGPIDADELPEEKDQ